MGTTSMHLLLAAPAAKPSGFSPVTLILIVIALGGMYMLMIRPQSRRRKQIQEQQNAVRPGVRVRTTAGMYATVIAVDDEAGDVVLEVAPGVETRYMKRAIMDVISDDEEPEGSDEAEPEETGDSEAVSDEVESAEDAVSAEDRGTAETAEATARSAGGTQD